MTSQPQSDDVYRHANPLTTDTSQIFALDALAEGCAADGRYEFMFSACPPPFTGSVGGPINPIAIK